jgi:hypothetical protein
MADLDEATELALALGVAARIFVTNSELEDSISVASLIRERLKEAGVVFSEENGSREIERFGEIVPVRGVIRTHVVDTGLEYTWEL